MKTETIKIGAEDYQLWDDFVANQKKFGTLFHTSSWLRIFNEKPDITALVQDGKIIGGSALAKIKKYGINGYHCLPYTPYYGILVCDEHQLNADTYIETSNLILKNLPKATVYDFLFNAGHQNIHPFVWKGFDVSVYVTHIIKSSITPSMLLQKISKGKKRDLQIITKLVENGELKILRGKDPELRKEMKQLVLDSSKRIGYSYPEWAFNKLMDYENTYTIALVHPSHGIISGNILFEDSANVYNLFNGSKRIADPKLTLANTLNTHESILYALNQHKSFDFEGSMLKGVERFYRSMGGEVTPVYRLIKSASLPYNAIRFIKNTKNGMKK